MLRQTRPLSGRPLHRRTLHGRDYRLGGGAVYPPWVLQGGGQPATLDIDFVNNQAFLKPTIVSIASLLTVTGGVSTGSFYTKADGTLQSFANNVLRYGTNGLLVEEARTNKCLRSQELDVNGSTPWAHNQATVTANATTAPDGTSTADKIVETAVNNAHYVDASPGVGSITSGVRHTWSAYFKAAERTWCQLRGSAVWAADPQAKFDLTNGVATVTSGAGAPTLATASIEALANGWFRCSLSATPNATGGAGFWFGTHDGTNFNYLGDVTKGVYCWGAQVEAGAFATSYIPTTTASVTRAIEAINLTSITGLTSTGTWYAQATVGATGAERELIEYDPVNVGKFQIFFISGGGAWEGGWNASQLTSLGASTVGATQKAAITFDSAGNMSGCFGGGTVQSTAASDYTGGATAIYIGSRSGSSRVWNSYIKRLAYWPTRLSNASLQALTT